MEQLLADMVTYGELLGMLEFGLGDEGGVPGPALAAWAVV